MDTKEKLRRVMARVARDADGRALLLLVRSKDGVIGYDETLPEGTFGQKTLEFDKLALRPKIVLRPEGDEARQASTLRHELRHVWQDFEEKVFSSRGIFPLQRLARKRVREGDAFTFQMMEGRPRARTDWAMAFEIFQKHDGAYYDEECIKACEREAAAVTVRTRDAFIVTRLREIFTINALPGLIRVPRMGVNAEAQPYLPYRDSREMADAVLRHVNPGILARARAITP
jgi:hypothetical protein